MKHRSRWRGWLKLAVTCLVLVCVLVLIEQTAMACPTCKDGMENDKNAASLVRGYFWSIVFMMSMPFLILTGLGSYFYWEVRRARAKAIPTDPGSAVPQT